MLKYIKPFEYINSVSFKILAIGQAILLIAIWFMLPNSILPNPIEIAQAWHNLASTQGMLVELGRSAIVILKAIAISALITGLLSFIATAALLKPVITWMTALRFLGFAGITFLFTLLTSDGSELKLWLLVFGLTTFQLTNSIGVIANIRQETIDYARTLRLDGWRLSYEIAFRGKLPDALDIIRQNAAIGWTLLSMVEGLVRSDGGIGAMLLNHSKHLHLSSIFAIQLTILGYGILQDYALKALREQLCPFLKFTNKR